MTFPNPELPAAPYSFVAGQSKTAALRPDGKMRRAARYGKLSMMGLVNAIMVAGAFEGRAETPAATSSASSSASSSSSADTSTGSGKKKDDSSLDEVVVTAKTQPDKSAYQTDKLSSGKYTESLRDTPQTVTVIPKAVMQEQNTSSLKQVLQNVPGVTMQAGEGGNLAGDNIVIRGFNARNDIFVDGVRDSGVYNRDPFNIEQVEVIKGPGSTVSGHGSTGGSVNMESKTPEDHTFYAGSIGLGTDQYTRETMDLNQVLPAFDPSTGIVDSAVRLNGVYQYNQFADRDIIYNNHWALAPSAMLKLGDGTKLTFTYLHQQESNLPSYGIPTVVGYAATANPGYVQGHPAPVPYSSFFGLSSGNYENTWTDIPTFKIEHEIDEDLKFSNTTRYDRTYRDSVLTSPRFENVGNGTLPTATIPLTAGQVAREQKGRHQLDTLMGNYTEVTQRFKTWDIGHTFVGTVEVSREQEAARTANGVPISTLMGDNYPYTLLYGDKTTATADTAAFSLFDTIKFDEHWEASLGMRYDHIQQDSQTLGYITPSGANHSMRTDDLPSWRSALVYKPIKPASFYFGYGTSFNASIQGTTNGTGAAGFSTNTGTLAPEADETYEFGTKWDVLKEKLSLTAALFRTNKTNARITDTTGQTSTYSLSGQQRVQGVELGATGNVTEHWQVIGGYTYMQSKVLSTDLANINTLNHQLPNTPQQSASVWTTYEFLKKLTLGTGWQFVDKRYENANNVNDVNGYWKQDAMVSYKVDENITTQLNITNLWDAHYIDTVGGNQDIPGAGRSIVFSTSFHY